MKEPLLRNSQRCLRQCCPVPHECPVPAGRISALYLNSHFMSPGASSNGRSSSALPDQVLSGMTPGAADGQRQQSAGAKAHQQESNGLAAVGGAAAGGFPAAGSPAGAEAVIVVPNDVELAVMNVSVSLQHSQECRVSACPLSPLLLSS